jgi:hypothetical protein
MDFFFYVWRAYMRRFRVHVVVPFDYIAAPNFDGVFVPDEFVMMHEWPDHLRQCQIMLFVDTKMQVAPVEDGCEAPALLGYWDGKDNTLSFVRPGEEPSATSE